MPDIPIGGQTKQFHRVLDSSGDYLPDATTVGGREAADFPAGNSDINTALDNVTTASQGFIVPPGQPFQVAFKGASATAIASTCVIQHYDPFLAAWVTLAIIEDAHIAKNWTLYTPNPVRIGVSAYDAGDATLSCTVSFNQSDRFGAN